MLQIIYSTVFRLTRLNNITLRVRLFNRLIRTTVVLILYNYGNIQICQPEGENNPGGLKNLDVSLQRGP